MTRYLVRTCCSPSSPRRLPLTASAQGTRLNLDLPDLAAKASETTDVTLDGAMLRLAGKFLSSNDADERAAKEMINGLSGIYVRSYEFDHEGEYDKSQAERIRQQLGPSWKKIVKVTSKHEGRRRHLRRHARRQHHRTSDHLGRTERVHRRKHRRPRRSREAGRPGRAVRHPAHLREVHGKHRKDDHHE